MKLVFSIIENPDIPLQRKLSTYYYYYYLLKSKYNYIYRSAAFNYFPRKPR